MSSVEALRTRAETAEQKIVDLQKQFDDLKIKFDAANNSNKSNSNTTTATTTATTNSQSQQSKSQAKHNTQSDEKKGDLPFDLIENEKFVISESGNDSTMTVTICNGESNPPFISCKGINYLKENYISKEKDIFVDTYAKCGTTVCINLVYQIYNQIGKTCDGVTPDKMHSPWDAVPWIEVEVSQELYKTGKLDKFNEFLTKSDNSDNNVRIWKSHAPWVNFPVSKIGELTKIIHCTRNPKDVVCSYFNFFQKEPFVAYKGDFNTLFDWFCDGSVVHSNFWDFELAWWRASQQFKKQILWLTFEEIVRIPHSAIRKVAKFLNVELTNEQINKVAYEISFDKMKTDALKDASGIGQALMNKGTIGRWQKKLTDSQSARMDCISSSRFANTGIEYDYGNDEQFAQQYYEKLRIE